MQVGLIGEQSGETGFAGSGRSPQDDGRQFARSDHPADRAFCSDQMVLADDVGQQTRSQPVGKGGIGRVFGIPLLFFVIIVKQSLHD